MPAEAVHVFSTCPQSREFAPAEYLPQVRRVSQWSEAAGCTGVLVYTDNGIVDPWLVAQCVLQDTRALCPLVAVQPVYMLPYSAAKMVASLTCLYGRRIWLNMLAGGFRNDLIALGDETPHDHRYLRTAEYARLMRRLLETEEPVHFAGRYYTAHGLRMIPPVPDNLRPGWLISGSSPAGRAAAAEIGAVSVQYPEPSDRMQPPQGAGEHGIRVGIIARDDAEEAWRVAWERFPDDRRGRLAHAMAMKTSDSSWHHTLSGLARTQRPDDSPYWLWPFEQHRTFCPYLVGDYGTVAREIARYLRLGYHSFILDIPTEAADLETAGTVFRLARQVCDAPQPAVT